MAVCLILSILLFCEAFDLCYDHAVIYVVDVMFVVGILEPDHRGDWSDVPRHVQHDSGVYVLE